jgi:pyrroline-5-carboxylate reductase
MRYRHESGRAGGGIAVVKLGFIGAGKMAGAIIGGILAKGLYPPGEIGIYDILPPQLERFSAMGCEVFDDIPSLAARCGMIILAIKPQSFPAALPELRKGIRRDAVVVSIAAGITAGTIKEALGFDCKIILVMPNTPLLLGQGASALARVEPTGSLEFAAIQKLFAAAGVAEEIDSEKMRAVIPVNGSSPAFVYLFAKTLMEEAVKAGIGEETAKSLVIQTLIGSAHMLRDSGNTPDELIDMVCSPGGTTVAAMEALRGHGFTDALREAFAACIRRADELSAAGRG